MTPNVAAANVDTEGMKQLRGLCSRLSKEGAIAALLAAMQANSSISSFELLTSGTVHQLKDYLLGNSRFCSCMKSVLRISATSSHLQGASSGTRCLLSAAFMPCCSR